MTTMKKIIRILLLVLPLLLAACSDDDTALVVTDVRSQSFTDDSHLNVIHPGQMIRIEGSGLSTLRHLYANGVEVKNMNPCFMTDTEIILKLPSTIPVDDELRDKTWMNSMRFVGSCNEVVFAIRITK